MGLVLLRLASLATNGTCLLAWLSFKWAWSFFGWPPPEELSRLAAEGEVGWQPGHPDSYGDQ
jgi:uncharacterized membrane protein YphA (DoxX/SURF4 family)